MDPDSVDFKFIIEFDDDGFDSEADSEEDSLVTSAAIERELNDLKHRLTSSLKEMETLQLQQTYFNPGLPPAFNWVEELNEKDLKVYHLCPCGLLTDSLLHSGIYSVLRVSHSTYARANL
ncbi:hypothetical protein FRC16_009966 [Serendipita sp. 398]|nr:hypothetical protein FRC16_009966 [Serendipita sp. 398]